MIERNLNAWYKFVPKQQDMNSYNCWYAEPLHLPANLERKMKDVATFVDIEHQFTKDELNVLSNAFNIGNGSALQPNTQYLCLPKAYLIGFPKCGTTLLYEYFESHPLFAKPHSKEGQFWREYVKTSKDRYKELEVLIYLFHFFGASQVIRSNPKMFTVDASASTVFAAAQPLVRVEYDMCSIPVTLFKTLSKSKFLIIMRNPIDRLWSDFWYFCSRWKANNKSKKNYYALASETFHNYTISAVKDFNTCVKDHTIFHCAMQGTVAGEDVACTDVRLGLGIYYAHMQRWLSVFPHDQILPIRMEDLVSDPVRTMNNIWSFLGVPSTDKLVPIEKKVNRGKTGGEFTILPETRKVLIDFFEPYNLMLANLLDDQGYLWK